ncbi:DUF4215 domain-containing protein [Nannocystis radixulma]|uniref:DUF4215 domain-containing protein n=1 Tax=Nannocystis radixulma TaxID=2995305 RepID=A0ABT5B0I3_9BACT|nr:DUF4215 domain-containing protein [Nannocystis radixulma]MDC0667248.1 DUF4215 domain-containing protein [Nannocystis radixulma]
MLRPCAASLLALLMSGCFSPSGSDSSGSPLTASETQATSTSTSTLGMTSTSEPTTTRGEPTTTSSSGGPTTEDVDPSTTAESTTAEVTGSSTTGMPAECGNEMIEPGEECDDTNAIPGDGCFQCMKESTCGDGVVDAGEECDGAKACSNCVRTHFWAFVTDEPVSVVEFGSLDGADTYCTKLANEADLPGHFVAWLSTGTQPVAMRLLHSAREWRTLNDQLIASNWDDLENGDLQRPLSVTEKGTELLFSPECGACPVWTASTVDGLPLMPNCSGWTAVGMESAAVGECSMADSHWTAGCDLFPCSTAARLYCFEQPPAP